MGDVVLMRVVDSIKRVGLSSVRLSEDFCYALKYAISTEASRLKKLLNVYELHHFN